MLSENKFNMLLQRVVFDHEILTHRVVARSFKVDTTTAKKILAEFVKRSDGRAHATYIVTGFIKLGVPSASGQPVHSNGSSHSGLLTSSNESQANGSAPMAGNADVEMLNGDDHEAIPSPSAPQAGPSSQAYVTELKIEEETPVDSFECIMLVPQEELEEKLPLFSTVLSQDVYSVEPSKLPDLVLLTDANAPVLKDKELAAVESDILGTIKHYRSNVKKSGKSGKASTSASTSTSTFDKTKDKGKTKDTSKLSAVKEKPDLKRKASNTELESKKDASKSAPSSKAPSPVATSKDKGKEKATSSRTAGPSLDDLFKADTTTKKESTGVAKSSTKQASKAAAAEDDFDDMLADDDDMMAELDALDKEKANKPSSQKTTKPLTSQSKPKADAKDKITLQSGSRRKIRKVKKQIQEVNAKGYKVTKEVETEEEYTASDSDDDGPVVASTSAASKLAKASKEKEQEKEKEKEKEKPKAKDKPAEKAKLEKKPSFTKNGPSSSSQSKPKSGAGGQTSLAGFFGKPKPKK